MRKEQIIEIVNDGGYIYFGEYQKTAIVYDAAGNHICHCPLAVMDRIAKVDGLIKWEKEYSGFYVSRYLGKKYQDYSNMRHCEKIAHDIDDYANGIVYKCPDCGEIITAPEDAEKYKCRCGFVGDLNEYEQQSMWDYFEDCLDVEYRCSSSRDYRSVQILVACGGPNIYVDTASNKVELYWWGDRADWPLSPDAVAAVDDWAEEYWRCL